MSRCSLYAVCGLLLIALISTPGAGQSSPHAEVAATALPDGPYFGQTDPGMTPRIFAPGLISLPSRRETKIAFSPDGREAFIGASKRILYTQQENGHWSQPRIADFLGAELANDVEPFISPDGQSLLFVRNGHIWLSARVNGTWAHPSPLLPPINSSSDEWHPTVTLDRTLYFCSTRDHVPGGYAIYRSRLKNGQYTEVQKLDGTINSQFGAWDPFIAPDESYLIFSTERPDGRGKHDQYISYLRNGTWEKPNDLGPAINTRESEYGSYISPDGKYYFFSRPTGWGANDSADIYWVDSRVVLGQSASQ